MNGALAPVTFLTEREYEVLQHVALGRSNVEIAGVLGISAYTVRNHLSHIAEKLGTSSRWQAVARVFGERSLPECSLPERSLPERSLPERIQMTNPHPAWL